MGYLSHWEDLELLVCTLREVMQQFESCDKQMLWKSIFVNALPTKYNYLKSILVTSKNASIEDYFESALSELTIAPDKSAQANVKFKANILRGKQNENRCKRCNKSNHSTNECRILKRECLEQQNKSSNPNNYQLNGNYSDNQRGQNSKSNYQNKNYAQANSNNNYNPRQMNNYNNYSHNNHSNHQNANRNYSSCNNNSNRNNTNKMNKFSRTNCITNSDRQDDEEIYPNSDNEESPRFKNYSLIFNVKMTKQQYRYTIDSGATDHMLISSTGCINLEFDNNKSSIYTASSEPLQITGFADKELLTKQNQVLILKNSVICPQLSSNFISVPKLLEDNHRVVFEIEKVSIYKNETLIGTGTKQPDGLFDLNLNDQPKIINNVSNKHCKTYTDEWYHKALAHINYKDLRLMEDRLNIKVKVDKPKCKNCIMAKITRSSFKPINQIKSTYPFQLVHTDTSGIINIPNRDKLSSFILFEDDFTRFTNIYLMKSKTEVPNIFKDYIKFTNGKLKYTLNTIKSDGGTEYSSENFNYICDENKISHIYSSPRCPQQNGTIERNMRTVDEAARCLLIESKLGISFWPYALMYAVFIRNRVPHSSLDGKIPYEQLFNEKYNYRKLKRFGSRVIYLNDDKQLNKFDPRGSEGIFLGFPSDYDSYYIYSIEKYKVIIRKNVKFLDDTDEEFFDSLDKEASDIFKCSFLNEENLIQSDILINDNSSDILDSNQVIHINDSVSDLNNEHINNQIDNDILQLNEQCDIVNQSNDLVNDNIINEMADDESQLTNQLQIDTLPPRGTTIELTETQKQEFKDRFPEAKLQFVCPIYSGKRAPGKGRYRLNSIFLPRNPLQANKCRDNQIWKSATMDELKSINDNRVWEEVTDRPKNHQVLPTMFLYKVKYKPNGEIDKYKVRMVVLGNIQRDNKNYNYAPVLNEVSFRTLLAFGIKNQMHCHQLDVCTAFLHAEIQEEVYVQLPKDAPEGYSNKIFKLKKSLYGLRSSALQWYKKMCSVLMSIGFRKSMSDNCVFIFKNGDQLALVGLYVDDIVLLTSDLLLMDKIKCKLNKQITLSDKNQISQFLNLEIEYNRDECNLSVNQSEYIKQCLIQLSMQDANEKRSPITPGTDIYSINIEPLKDRGDYLSIVGSLIYLSVHSRPDITFVVSRLCQHMQQPSQQHLEMAKRVLKYLKFTVNYKLCFKPNNDTIDVYCDADYGNDAESSKSINGMCLYVFGCLVNRSSKRQHKVSTSTCQAELLAISDGVNEMIYIKNLINEFSDVSNIKFRLFSDNNGAISTCYNGGSFSKNKQYRIKINGIMDEIREGWIVIVHCPFTNMVADLLTKPLVSNKIEQLSKLMGLF